MKRLFFLLIVILTSAVSCKKDAGNPGNNSSRTIRYELTGNFSGTLIASYTTATGSTVNEQVASLQWNKEVTYAAGVTAAIIAVSGNGGTAGQQVTMVVKKGANQVSSTLVTANSAGSFTQAAPVITF